MGSLAESSFLRPTAIGARFERELHDGVQQQLVALAVNPQLSERLVDDDPEAAKALLESMGRDVQQALEGRRSSRSESIRRCSRRAALPRR